MRPDPALGKKAERGARVGALSHPEDLNLHVNFSFSEVTEAQIADMVRDVAKAKPRAISTFCTNLKAAHLVPRLEEETGIPIYDTISTVVWKSLQIAGFDTRTVKGWGRLFEGVA